jgi:pSer/pThr/pTyr-binding forkhead associated (FHA) protein
MDFDKTMIPETVGPKLALIAMAGPYEGGRFPIVTLPLTIGRKAPNSIVLDKDKWVSSNHCRIFKTDKGIFIEDLGSANGSYVNGKKITEPTLIVAGRNQIAVGKTLFAFVDEGATAEDQSSKTLNINDLIASGAFAAKDGFLGSERTEALFVVDICNSTNLINQYGEKAYFSVLMEIAKSITRNADMELIQYMQHTGDGFFVTFKETAEAIEVAARLIKDIKAFTPEGEVPNPGIRVAIHHGKVVTNINGDRMGIACHLTFRLEGAKEEDLVKPAPEPVTLPKQNRILITDQAVEALKGRLASHFTPVGEFNFKGFDDPVSVNLVTGDLDQILSELAR